MVAASNGDSAAAPPASKPETMKSNLVGNIHGQDVEAART